VNLENLGNLNTFIGKNSTGKSNLLVGIHLFFNEFSLTGGTTPGLNAYFWFNRETQSPIEFVASIMLSENECSQIFPAEMLKAAKARSGDIYSLLTINRKILNLQGAWKTEYLKWANIPLVVEDKPLTPDEVSKRWADLTRGETGTLPSITPDMLSSTSTKIVERVKKGFNLISAIRDVKNPVALRMTLLDTQVQSYIWTLEQSVNPPEETKYAQIEDDFRKITGQRIDPAQGQVFVKRATRRIPFYLEGGGIQGALNLIVQIRSEVEKGFIYGIEEPEAHSHANLQRSLFQELGALSDSVQILLATHSPIFVDRSDIANTWMTKLVGNETNIERISELKEIFDELGARPSDILFANRMLFVEGKSDEMALLAFARKLGLDLSDIAIVPVEGKNKARLNLKTWIKITRNALPIYLILDNDAKQEAQQLERDGLIEPGRYHIWENGTIENYYPHDVLKEALEEIDSRYNLGIELEKVMQQIRQGSLSADRIDLGEKKRILDKSWEVILAERVARLINARDVRLSDEVRRVLERVAQAT